MSNFDYQKNPNLYKYKNNYYIGINTNVSQTYLKLQNLSIFVTFVSNPCQKINNPKIKNMYTSLNYFLIFIYKLEHATKEITPQHTST